MRMQVYLHFPFCMSKCRYCDFCSAAPKPGEMAAYCHALEKEIYQNAPLYRDFEIDTVFLGGGTPSVISPALMDGVLTALSSHYNIMRGAEITTEANPGTLTDAFLSIMVKHNVNRVSLGMQAKQEKLLALLGRIHSFEQVVSSVLSIRRAGISNINLDVMNGLPTQTRRDYLETLEAACDLRVQHISAYSLIVEDGTPLKAAIERGELALPGEDEACDMEEAGRAYLRGRGYQRYEISNFAREGFECRHNLGYWQGKYYLGMGLAAHSMLPPLASGCYDRAYNTSDLQEYIKRLENGQSPVAARAAVERDEAMFENMMLGLRTTAGVDIAAFSRRFGLSPSEQYGKALDKLVRDGLMTVTQDAIQLSERGMSVQNAVLLPLMPASMGAHEM